MNFNTIKTRIFDNPLVFILLLIIIVMAFIEPRFISRFNIINVIRQAALVGIVAVGMTFVIISGGIDLSVGSVMAMAAVLTAGLYKFSGLPIFISLIFGLLAGVLSGAIVGYLIYKWKIPPFIASLGAMGAVRGLALVYSASQPIPGLPKEFRYLGTGLVGYVPVPVIIWAVIIIIAYYFQNYHKYGRYNYALGGNKESLILSGVNINKYYVYIYMIAGLLSGIAGVLYCARLDSGQPMLGVAFELHVIAAVCLGGASLLGGSGTILGSVLGAILISVIINVMSILGLSTFTREIAVGVMLIVILSLNIFKSKKAK